MKQKLITKPKRDLKNKIQAKICLHIFNSKVKQKKKTLKTLYKNLLPYKTPRIKHLSQLQDP